MSKVKVKTRKVGTFRIPGCRKSVQKKPGIAPITNSIPKRSFDFRHKVALEYLQLSQQYCADKTGKTMRVSIYPNSIEKIGTICNVLLLPPFLFLALGHASGNGKVCSLGRRLGFSRCVRSYEKALKKFE